MAKEPKTSMLETIQLTRRTALLGLAGAGLGVSTGRLFVTPARAAVGGSLQIMAWEGYDMTNELREWRSTNGVTAETSSIASQDDVQAKFIAGNPPPIDLAEYNQAYSKLYIKDMKIVSPIDMSKIPNYNADNLFDVFFDKPTWFSDGKHWGSPYIWGFNTLLYNSDMIKKPASYKDLLDPSLKGKIAIMDDATGNWPLIARLVGLGDKYPLLTREELAKAFENYVLYRNQARLISINQGDVANFVASKEVAAVLVADPSIITQVRAQGVPLEMAIPEEGPVLWVDAWFIPISADNIDTAHAFINQSLDPQIQAKVATAVVQAPVSKKAVELLDADARKRIDYSKINEIFASGLPGIPPVDDDGEHATYADWVQAWQEFKAGL
ncbi:MULTISPECIES: PotD/PotF family extracellular solute-binding protein [unclassified Mesorhizobium]|uniref:ABC transporter substrate-binding protein n=1 Tax=unclassified Mesorhizobium TaxID=325217 RepID=UPI00112AF9AB|nr:MULTISPECIES: PotD/PotF family extracellular solute-binding protein [unclassified Mesorhizobium]TPM93505.1 extracellular solute-binding protein [Mesorhizobium sp. B2-1-3A]